MTAICLSSNTFKAWICPISDEHRVCTAIGRFSGKKCFTLTINVPIYFSGES